MATLTVDYRTVIGDRAIYQTVTFPMTLSDL